MHSTIRKVSDDYGVRQQFNTAIARGDGAVSTPWTKPRRPPSAGRAVAQETLESAVMLLAPIIMPHVTDALWSEPAAGTDAVEAQRWPSGGRQRAGAGRDRADGAGQ